MLEVLGRWLEWMAIGLAALPVAGVGEKLEMKSATV